MLLWLCTAPGQFDWLIGARRGGLWGLALLAPFAGCLLASSALLLRATQTIAAEQALDEEGKLALLRTAIASSERIIATGTVLSLLVSASLAFELAARNLPRRAGGRRQQ